MKPKLVLLTICAAAMLCFSCGSTSRTERVAGTNCVVRVATDGHGKIIDVDTDPPCHKGRASAGIFVVVPPQNARDVMAPPILIRQCVFALGRRARNGNNWDPRGRWPPRKAKNYTPSQRLAVYDWRKGS